MPRFFKYLLAAFAGASTLFALGRLRRARHFAYGEGPGFGGSHWLGKGCGRGGDSEGGRSCGGGWGRHGWGRHGGWGRGGWGGRHGGHGFDRETANRYATRFLEFALDRIDANAAQRASILALKDRLLNRALDLKESHKATRQEILEQWSQAEPDAARVHSTVDGRFDAMREFAHEVADAALEVHRLLTPEQREIISRRFRRSQGYV